VVPDWSEYQRVAQSCITSELDFEGLFAVTKIERIEIPRLQRLFEAKKNAMAATDDHHHASPSVQVAYHGTAEQNIRSIAQNNLSMDCVGRNTDCSFGAGMYVSPHSNLAAGYSGTGTIIHFDVLRGRVYTCPDERDCRQIPLEPGHDSHQWDEEEDIWVVFDSHQLLPRYIITGGFDGSFDY
jgi:hypothetical protein